MHLPSARPEERSIYAFSVSPLYTAAQVVLGIAIPFIFLAATGLFVQVGIIDSESTPTSRQVAVVAGSLVGLIPILAAAYLRLARHYFITTERVIAVIGWLAQDTISIDYPAITDLTVSRDVFERFVTQSGNLAIDTAGSPAEEIVLIHIANPIGVRDQILELVEKSKILIAKLGRSDSSVRTVSVAPSSSVTPIRTNPDVVDTDNDGIIDVDEPTTSTDTRDHTGSEAGNHTPGAEEGVRSSQPAMTDETP